MGISQTDLADFYTIYLPKCRYEKWCRLMNQEIMRLAGDDKGQNLIIAVRAAVAHFDTATPSLNELMNFKEGAADSILDILKSHRGFWRFGEPASQKIYEKTFPMDDIKMTVDQAYLANIQFPAPNAAANPRP